MSIVVLNGMGKSFYSLIMDVISLGVALALGYFLIPAFGLVGAALSMLGYNVVAIICNNIYLLKMGYRPYSIRLVSQVVWIIGLITFYVMINVKQPDFSLVEKGGIYLGVLALLGIYWKIVKKKMDADREKLTSGKG